jgi:hypothetical protein
MHGILVCRRGRLPCFIAWLILLLLRRQVVVVPLRVNVNLKAVTVEELERRRKVRTGAFSRWSTAIIERRGNGKALL